MLVCTSVDTLCSIVDPGRPADLAALLLWRVAAIVLLLPPPDTCRFALRCRGPFDAARACMRSTRCRANSVDAASTASRVTSNSYGSVSLLASRASLAAIELRSRSAPAAVPPNRLLPWGLVGGGGGRWGDSLLTPPRAPSSR